MSAHRPKTAALIAYAEDLLSAAGRARVERHLAGCDACRRELASIRAYDEVAEDAREAPVPELDFRRMEGKLAREAERISREIVLRRRRPWGLVVLAAAAAALLAIYLGWPARDVPVAAHEPHPEPEVTQEQAAPEPALLSPMVTLAAGTATRASDASALRAGALLTEGEHLRTADDGLLHVRLADETGFVAAPGSEIELTRVREDAVALTLARGRADNVATFRNGSSYVVLAGGYTVEGHGARFVVSYVDLVVGVDVAEGTVRVRNPSGEELVLEAPARWRSSGEASGEAELATPRELAVSEDQDPRTSVTVEHPSLVRWEIDGTSIDTAGPVSMRLTSGEHELRGWDLRDRLYTALVQVGSDPVFVEPGALRPEPPRIRAGHLPEDEINRVLQRGRAQLARCYERTLRLHPEVHGRLRLRVTVGVMGDVGRVSVLGAEASDTDELAQCISTYAARWTFPPPGGPVTFEVPLAFSARE